MRCLLKLLEVEHPGIRCRLVFIFINLHHHFSARRAETGSSDRATAHRRNGGATTEIFVPGLCEITKTLPGGHGYVLCFRFRHSAMDSPYEIRLRDLDGGVGRLRDPRMVNAFKHWRELIDFGKCLLSSSSPNIIKQTQAEHLNSLTRLCFITSISKQQIDGRILFLVITLPRDRTKAGIAPT